MSDTSVSELSSSSTTSTDGSTQAAVATAEVTTSGIQIPPVIYYPPTLHQVQQDNTSLLEVVKRLKEELEKHIGEIVDEDTTLDDEAKLAKKQTITDGLQLVIEALQGAISSEAEIAYASQLANSVSTSANATTVDAKKAVLQKISDLESTLRSIKTTYADSFFDQPTKITEERIKNLRTKAETDLIQQTKALEEVVHVLQIELNEGMVGVIPTPGQGSSNWDELGNLLQGSDNWNALGALLQSSDNWDALESILGFSPSITDATDATANQVNVTDNWSIIQTLLGFSDSTLPPPSPPAVLLEVIPSIVGEYENHLYDQGGKNNWHYVTISRDSTDRNILRWTNRAGVSWTLVPTESKEILAVGQDCPYYAKGHTQVKVKWENAQVIGLTGPYDELYDREQPEVTDGDATQVAIILAMLGNYENHLYDQGGKNNWHYVAISRDATDPNILRWTNRAGVSWTLTPTDNKEILAVGEDCPYYAQGYTQARVQWENDQVIGLLGPGNEPYDRAQSTGTDSGDSALIEVLLLFLGEYENHLYDQGGKNNWHYVTISRDNTNSNILRWTNRAGASWTLTPTNNKAILIVGKDCPYYSRGHTQVTVKWDNDQVIGLLGPFNELYEKETSQSTDDSTSQSTDDSTSTQLSVLSLFLGEYENHLYDQGGKNNWHYVTISWDTTNNNALRWTNRAGVSWTLTPTSNKEILAVGQDCPYYSRGYTQAIVQWDNNGQVTGLLGPGNEPYDRKLTQ